MIVNRIWQGHFGAGIVRTPDNFGRLGDRPSNPELLDYLAQTFMDNGWSIKKMHRAHHAFEDVSNERCLRCRKEE